MFEQTPGRRIVLYRCVCLSLNRFLCDDLRKFSRQKTMASTSVAQNCRIDDLENEVTEVTALLRHNVEKILERGEKIDKLQSRSEDLECSSCNFKLSAAKTRRRMWWRNFRLSCILGLIIFIILVITITVILVITDPWATPDSREKHNCTEHVDGSSRRTLQDVFLYP